MRLLKFLSLALIGLLLALLIRLPAGIMSGEGLPFGEIRAEPR